MLWQRGSVVGLSAETLGFELGPVDLAFVTQPGTGTEFSPGTSVFVTHYFTVVSVYNLTILKLLF